MGFSPCRGSYAKFHHYGGKNVGIQPLKLSKFGILSKNSFLWGNSFALFL